jgi:hypothetical protein
MFPNSSVGCNTANDGKGKTNLLNRSHKTVSRMETRSSSSSRRPRRDDANDKPHWQPQQRADKEQQLLDFFAVRPDHVPPPLCLPIVLGGRVSLSTIVNTGLVIFFFWYGFRQWGFVRGFCCAYLPCCEIILQLVDVLSSQATSRNIQSLRRQGVYGWYHSLLSPNQLATVAAIIVSDLCGNLRRSTTGRLALRRVRPSSDGLADDPRSHGGRPGLFRAGLYRRTPALAHECDVDETPRLSPLLHQTLLHDQSAFSSARSHR